MLGSHALLSLLIDEGVTHLFGNPGTTELPLMAALPDYPQIDYVLGAQEAAVVAMADGYARASGRLAACNLHVAPGLGNAVGSLFNASWIGSPLIVTAGQHPVGHGLTEPMLYAPLEPMARPHVKWAVEATRLDDLPRIVRRAAKIALAPPTGPVFISLPGNVLTDDVEVDLGRCNRVEARVRPADAVLDALADRLLAARRPVMVVGHEVNTRSALPQAAGWPSCSGPAFTRTPFPPRPRSYRRTRASWACSAATSETWRSVSAPTTCCSVWAPTCCACRCRDRRRCRGGWPSCRWGSGRPTSPRTTRPSWRCRRTSARPSPP